MIHMKNLIKQFPGVDEKHYITIRQKLVKFKKLGITVQEYYKRTFETNKKIMTNCKKCKKGIRS